MRLAKQGIGKYVVVRDYDDASIGAVTQGDLALNVRAEELWDDFLDHLIRAGRPGDYELINDGHGYLIVSVAASDESPIVASFWPKMAVSGRHFIEQYFLKGA